MRAAALVLILAGCASVPSGTRPVGVAEALARHHELDGLMIEVEGVVTSCKRMGCALHDLSDATKSFGLGGNDAFDAAVRRSLGRPIVVRGRFDAACVHGRIDPPGATKSVQICLDRSTALHDPQIVAVR